MFNNKRKQIVLNQTYQSKKIKVNFIDQNNSSTSEYEQQFNPIVFNISQNIENYNKNNLINKNQPNITNIKVDVPSDGNCLFWASILAYLLPVKNNEQKFHERYKNLFGNKQNWKDEYHYICNLNFNDLAKKYSTEMKNEYINIKKNIISPFRTYVVNYMKNNSKEFEKFISDDYNKYLSKMNEDDTWGSETEIKAISQFLKIKVIVDKINKKNYEKTTTIYSKEYKDEIRLVHVNDNHYNFFLKQDANEFSNLITSPQADFNISQNIENHNENNLLNSSHHQYIVNDSSNPQNQVHSGSESVKKIKKSPEFGSDQTSPLSLSESLKDLDIFPSEFGIFNANEFSNLITSPQADFNISQNIENHNENNLLNSSHHQYIVNDSSNPQNQVHSGSESVKKIKKSPEFGSDQTSPLSLSESLKDLDIFPSEFGIFNANEFSNLITSPQADFNISQNIENHNENNLLNSSHHQYIVNDSSNPQNQVHSGSESVKKIKKSPEFGSDQTSPLSLSESLKDLDIFPSEFGIFNANEFSNLITSPQADFNISQNIENHNENNLLNSSHHQYIVNDSSNPQNQVHSGSESVKKIKKSPEFGSDQTSPLSLSESLKDLDIFPSEFGIFNANEFSNLITSPQADFNISQNIENHNENNLLNCFHNICEKYIKNLEIKNQEIEKLLQILNEQNKNFEQIKKILNEMEINKIQNENKIFDLNKQLKQEKDYNIKIEKTLISLINFLQEKEEKIQEMQNKEKKDQSINERYEPLTEPISPYY